MNVCQQGFRSIASFGFGGQESASKPVQTICKPLGPKQQNMNLLENFHEKIDSVDLDATNEHDINKELQGINEQLEKEGLAEVLRLSELERQCYALRVSFDQDSETGKIKGVSWQMSGTAKNEDGEEIPVVWPDISQFTENDFKYIEERYKSTKNLYTKTHFGLILYFQNATAFSHHNDFKKQLCSELFELAQSYKVKALSTEKKRHYSLHLYQAIKAALQLAIRSKFDDLKNDITSWLLDLHSGWDLNRDDALRILLDVTHLFVDNYKHVKNDIKTEDILKQNLAGVETQAKKYTWGAIYILDSSNNLDQKAGLGYYDYKKRKAELYEQLADEAEGTPRQLAAISFVENSLRLYRELKDEENIKRLEKRYQEIRGTGNFGTVQQELEQDLVKAITENINKEIEAKSPQEILQTLSISPMFSSHEVIKESSEEAYAENISLSLFGTSIADKFGNTVAKYTSEEERKLFSFWQTYGFHFQMGAQWLTYYFMEAFKKGKIDCDTTLNFLSNSWLNEPIPRNYNGTLVDIKPIDILIPPIRLLFKELEAWSKDKDFEVNTVVLNDSLTLKIEALLRYMCERIGIATFKPKDKGIVMEKNIDDILADMKDDPGSATGFSENDRLFIKFVLSEKAGQNLRNRIAHGLMDIHDYGFDNIIVVFTIILRFAKYGFTTEEK